jgi:ubiquinone/menaquinone biosynthesis C-methylase UbiE
MAERYVPAAGHAALTRLYDPMIGLTMREGRWRARLARLAVEGFEGGETVVDVGAGTGAQSLELADADQYARVLAVDGDPQALAIAQRKVGAELIDWRTGMAGDLPVPTGAADAVVMTLLLHHLDAAGKRAALGEALRVLRPGGRLCVADWGVPRGLLPALGARMLRRVDGAAGLDDQLAGALPRVIEAAGFEPPRLHERLATVWGTLELLVARRP